MTLIVDDFRGQNGVVWEYLSTYFIEAKVEEEEEENEFKVLFLWCAMWGIMW